MSISVGLVCLLSLHACYSEGDVVNIGRSTDQNPPHFWKKAETARYIAHNTNWAVIGTISTMTQILNRPFTNTKSFCDGTKENSTGIPYFYVMDQDASMVDMTKNPYMSMTMTEAMTDYCTSKKYDPEDPRCARLTLTGRMVNVTGEEKDFALKCLFSRHPEMKHWSLSHGFYPTKLDIDMIWLLDFFGRASYVPLEAYYAVHV